MGAWVHGCMGYLLLLCLRLVYVRSASSDDVVEKKKRKLRVLENTAQHQARAGALSG